MGTALRRRWLRLAFCLFLVGCSGGEFAPTAPGGGDGGGEPADTVDRSGPGTARFEVDVTTGEVTVVPLSGSRAVLAGTAVQFETSTLLDEPGDVGLRAVEVGLVNRWAMSIGQQASGRSHGVRVILGPPTSLGTQTTDLRSRTLVETIAGTGAAGAADGPANAATFALPNGVAVDGRAVFISDCSAHNIRKLADGYITTVAGSGGSGLRDGAGAFAKFNAPAGLAIGPDHALFVADGTAIRRVDAHGSVVTIAGSSIAGGADGPGNLATFNRPLGLCFGPEHDLLFVTEAAHRIRMITMPAGGADPTVAANYTVTTLAGNGTAGFADGNGAGARFNEPSGIALVGGNTLLVTDTRNHRIRGVNFSGQVTTIAGTGTAGVVDGLGNVARFDAPHGIVCLDGGACFVTDRAGRRLRQMTRVTDGAHGGTASSWLVASLAGGAAGDVDGTGDLARFQTPRHLAVSHAGTLYLADEGARKVKEIRPDSGFFPLGTPTGSTATEPVRVSNADGHVSSTELGAKCPYYWYSGALSPGMSTGMRRWTFVVPEGVSAFEFSVEVEAPTAILAPPGAETGVGASEVMVTTLGGSQANHIHDGTLGVAMFSYIDDIAVDDYGVLYLAGNDGDVIRRVDPFGRVTTIAGGFGSGSADGPGTTALLNSPTGLAVTPDGRAIFVTDSANNTIRRIGLTGSDAENPAHWTVATIAGLAGPANYANGDGTAARFCQPFGCGLDAGGNLYVVERLGQRVRRISFRGGDPMSPGRYQVWHVAGDVGAVVPPNGLAEGNGGVARFSFPRDVKVAPDGTVYVYDAGNNRVRRLDNAGAQAASVTVSTLAGSSAGYLDGPGATARFQMAYGQLEVDRAGWLYLTDDQNHRLRRISPSGVVSTIAGGVPSGWVDGPGNVARFTEPVGLGISPSGDLYLSDGNQSSLLRVVERVVERE